MPDAQKPSIGRIVHYYNPNDKRAFAAVITSTIAENSRLSSDLHVNLTVFSEYGWIRTAPGDDVPFSDVRTDHPHWRWPPRA